MWNFMDKHPVAAFLIVFIIMSGLIDIVNRVVK